MATVTFTFGGSPSEVHTVGYSLKLTNVTSGALIKNSGTYGASVFKQSDGTTDLSPSLALSGAPVGYDGGTGIKYVTYRNLTAVNNLVNNQYPSAGMSFDIWSDDFYTAWNNNNYPASTTYGLNANKYSVIYVYNGPYAIFYQKGGTVTISIV